MKKIRSSRLDQPRSRGLQFKNVYDSERFGLVSERVARQIGSWRFIALMTVFVVAWISWNTLGPIAIPCRSMAILSFDFDAFFTSFLCCSFNLACPK